MARRTKRLLVEGFTDEKVVEHLFRWHGCTDLCDIRNQGGVDPLLETVPVLVKGSIERFGVVLDADLDVGDRWAALADRLRAAGYQDVPDRPVPGGLILRTPDLPVAGVWIMPDNRLPGMIEDFVRLLVPASDVLWPYAESVVAEVANRDRRFLAAHESKARIHTWLAWQADPGTPLGLAITKRYLDAGAREAAEFIKWARDLFEDTPGGGTET